MGLADTKRKTENCMQMSKGLGDVK
jgi:hypothetical protein